MKVIWRVVLDMILTLKQPIRDLIIHVEQGTENRAKWLVRWPGPCSDKSKSIFSIYVGAPLQQHSDGSRGAIHFSDYDTIDHRWIFPEQIPHKHFRRVSLAGNHVINITTNFIGHIVKVSANEKRAFYTCDSQLQFNLKCDPLGTCYALTVSEPSVSESESVHFSDHRVQFGGCFFVRNIQKLLRNHSPRSLRQVFRSYLKWQWPNWSEFQYIHLKTFESPKFAQFWNPLVQMNLINNELVYSQRISLLGKGLSVAYTVYCILIYQIECQ